MIAFRYISSATRVPLESLSFPHRESLRFESYLLTVPIYSDDRRACRLSFLPPQPRRSFLAKRRHSVLRAFRNNNRLIVINERARSLITPAFFHQAERKGRNIDFHRTAFHRRRRHIARKLKEPIWRNCKRLLLGVLLGMRARRSEENEEAR